MRIEVVYISQGFTAQMPWSPDSQPGLTFRIRPRLESGEKVRLPRALNGKLRRLQVPLRSRGAIEDFEQGWKIRGTALSRRSQGRRRLGAGRRKNRRRSLSPNLGPSRRRKADDAAGRQLDGSTQRPGRRLQGPRRPSFQGGRLLLTAAET